MSSAQPNEPQVQPESEAPAQRRQYPERRYVTPLVPRQADADLVARIVGGRWRASASCAGLPTQEWFPDVGSPHTAKRVCAACPVARECLAWALVFDEEHGLWGGQTPRVRLRMRSRLLAGQSLSGLLDRVFGVVGGEDGEAAA